jgi:hypothetical protein
MATGRKVNTAKPTMGTSVCDLYGISYANATGWIWEVINQDGSMLVRGTKLASTITSSTYNVFPTGSVLIEASTGKIYVKKDATTWTVHTPEA